RLRIRRPGCARKWPAGSAMSKTPGSSWKNELEDRNSAGRRHRPRGRFRMRQGDEDRRRARAARDRVAAVAHWQVGPGRARPYPSGTDRTGLTRTRRLDHGSDRARRLPAWRPDLGDAAGTQEIRPVRRRAPGAVACGDCVDPQKRGHRLPARAYRRHALFPETVVAGLPEFRPNDDITVAMRVITRKGSNRVAREAFEIARIRERKKVTAAHKEPVYRLPRGMFAQKSRQGARAQPDRTLQQMMIDSISMKLVTAPQQFDVVVTTNQFGDILTDIGAGLVGGLGLAPGLCVGERQAMAQATHGSAPDIAGRNIANPYAMIMSGQM